MRAPNAYPKFLNLDAPICEWWVNFLTGCPHNCQAETPDFIGIPATEALASDSLHCNPMPNTWEEHTGHDQEMESLLKLECKLQIINSVSAWINSFDLPMKPVHYVTWEENKRKLREKMR